MRAYMAGKPWAWEWIEHWIALVVNKPGWIFLSDRVDVIHDSHVAIHRRLPHFKGDSQLKTYVCSIAYNTCVNHYREYLRRKYCLDLEEVEIASHNPGPLEEILGKERVALQAAALAVVLDSADRTCLDLWLMHYWGRITYEIIAQTLGVALNTVKVRAFRCRDKARKALQTGSAGENH